MTVKKPCPSCGSEQLSIFYDVRNVPIHSCLLMPTRLDALNLPRGDIILSYCEHCGFITNSDFDPKLLDYSKLYEDQQCFSSTFNIFTIKLANCLIEKYDIYNKDILEIGCGKGDFLLLLCKLGNNRGIGIDPAYIEGRLKIESSYNLKFIQDYYSDRYSNYIRDFVCCRHTLEHIYNTAEFISSIRRSINNSNNTIVFFEVPDVSRILREVAFWDIYYEHCSYFSPGSIARLFRSCKFEIIEFSRGFKDQYLLLVIKPINRISSKIHPLEESIENLVKDIDYFSTHYPEKLDKWKNFLKQIEADEKRAVIWGSGSKCVAFLTILRVGDKIVKVIDINPHRQGKFLPGVGKEIMPPEFLKEYRPDITIVMNPIYQDEIKQILDNMSISTEIILVE